MELGKLPPLTPKEKDELRYYFTEKRKVNAEDAQIFARRIRLRRSSRQFLVQTELAEYALCYMGGQAQPFALQVTNEDHEVITVCPYTRRCFSGRGDGAILWPNFNCEALHTNLERVKQLNKEIETWMTNKKNQSDNTLI